jgi:hypothetical protein
LQVAVGLYYRFCLVPQEVEEISVHDSPEIGAVKCML